MHLLTPAVAETLTPLTNPSPHFSSYSLLWCILQMHLFFVLCFFTLFQLNLSYPSTICDCIFSFSFCWVLVTHSIFSQSLWQYFSPTKSLIPTCMITAVLLGNWAWYATCAFLMSLCPYTLHCAAPYSLGCFRILIMSAESSIKSTLDPRPYTLVLV